MNDNRLNRDLNLSDLSLLRGSTVWAIRQIFFLDSLKLFVTIKLENIHNLLTNATIDKSIEKRRHSATRSFPDSYACFQPELEVLICVVSHLRHDVQKVISSGVLHSRGLLKLLNVLTHCANQLYLMPENHWVVISRLVQVENDVINQSTLLIDVFQDFHDVLSGFVDLCV